MPSDVIAINMYDYIQKSGLNEGELLEGAEPEKAFKEIARHDKNTLSAVEFYDEFGYLSKTRIFENEDKSHYTCEKIFTVKGNCKIIINYHLRKAKNRVKDICLLDDNENIMKNFLTEQELFIYFIDQITNDNFQYIVVADSPFTHKVPLSINKKNLIKACVIHSKFLINANDLTSPPEKRFKTVCSRLKEFDGIVVLTEQAKNDLEYVAGYCDNISVIPHCYHNEIIKVEYEKRNLNKVVFVARLAVKKRPDLAIRIFQRVIEKRPSSILEIYGSGDEDDKLRKLIRDLKLENNVILKGFTNNPINVFRDSALSLCTSSSEGFNLSILESISNGCPVVSYDIKYGPSEMIKNDINGYLFPFGTIEETADKIVEILNNKDTLYRLSENSYKIAAEFDRKSFVEKWYSFLETLLLNQKKLIDNRFYNEELKKKKVGIITMYTKNLNYGGVLQAYALTNKINMLGFDCEQICYRIPSKVNPLFSARFDSIKSFKFKKIHHSLSFYNGKTIHQCVPNYDIFICGSDQVWNTTGRLKPYYLEFVPEYKLKVAYAASFGRAKLPMEEVDLISGWLKDFHKISTREIDGQKILKKQLGLDSEVTLDPTLLLEPEEWDEIAEDRLINIPYMFVYLLGSSVEHRKLIKQYARDLRLKIVFIPHIHFKYNEKDIGFADIEIWDAGPEMFISLIKHANMIITDSFHGCIFLIIYKKNFWALKRFNDRNPKSMNSRIYSLFESLHIKNRILDVAEKIDTEELSNEIDYTRTQKALQKLKKKSIDFLKNIENLSLDIQSANNTEKNIEIKEKKYCTGCYTCKNICPIDCISMPVDEEGFWYPKVDQHRCINCKQCIKSCPISNKRSASIAPKAYACMNKDEEIRLKSSSGGIFTLLAEETIHNSGVVFGAGFGEKLELEHSCVETLDDLEKFIGSKYIQSKVGSSYKNAKAFLDSGRKVLFSGTPCQIEGLNSFLGNSYDNLLRVDLICHGVPSPAVWNQYILYLENTYGSKVDNVFFRKKNTGWRNYSVYITFKDGSDCSQIHKDNLFMTSFLKNLCLRPSCYSCHFKGINRNSDITLGDFWGIHRILPDMYDNKGTSLIFINSYAGKKILEAIEEKILFHEVSINDAIKFNSSAIKSCKLYPSRTNFLNDLEEKPFDILVKNNLN